MFLFFLLSAIIILELDRMVFLPLGHVGLKQRLQQEDISSKHLNDESVVIIKEGYEGDENMEAANVSAT